MVILIETLFSISGIMRAVIQRVTSANVSGLYLFAYGSRIIRSYMVCFGRAGSDLMARR